MAKAERREETGVRELTGKLHQLHNVKVEMVHEVVLLEEFENDV